MNRFNIFANAIAIALTVVAGGYMFLESSGFGFLPVVGEPDDAWFRSTVLERAQPVVVKFGADWCGPCRMLDPELDRLAGSGGVAVVKIDIGRSHELARHYRVSAIPDVYLFHKGAVVAHRVGYADYDHLRRWIKQHVPQ
jgi:thioredoxin